MKIKSKRHIYFIFAIISLLIAWIIFSIVKKNNLQYNFRLDKKTPSNEIKTVSLYNDLDNDGISEEIKLDYKNGTNFYYLNVYNSKGIKIAKLDIGGITNFRWSLFADYNNDGYKEIFSFSELNDSLFLSVFNVKAHKLILDRQFILSKPDSAKKGFWDIEIRPITLQTTERNNFKELVFYVRGNISLWPRTVYSYNIEKKKIIKRFITGSILSQPDLADITNDGNKEIILSTAVVGNTKRESGFHDHTGWIFVLDKSLNAVFPPKNFGSYPGDNHIIHFRKNGKSYFYILYYNKLNNKEIVKSLLLNSIGKEIPHSDNFNISYRLPLKVTENGTDVIYIANDNGNIFKLNTDLEVIKHNELHCSAIDFISEITICKQNKRVLLVRGTKQIYLMDKKLNLIAKYNLDENFWRIGIKFKKLNGKNNLPQLPILTRTNNYLFTIVENKLYGYLPLVFFGTGLFSFLMFYAVHLLLTFLSTYTKYFGYSLNKSTKGVAILDYNGKIFYSNKNIKNFLRLNTELKRGAEYKNIFTEHKDIYPVINNAIKTQKIISQKIQISSSDFQFEGSVTVTPFTSFIGFTYAYLIEISDYTEALLTDRGKIWGATLQRIAHEIKTPLSGINLGLNTLSSRLSKETDKYARDIALIQNEVDRIRALTKNFLLFSNMEKPNFTKVQLNRLLDESISVFDSYLNSGMEIEIQPTNHTVFGDELQLKQLFHIIIENAIDACGGKGKIEIKTEGRKQKTGKPGIKITVSDGGKGISEEKLTKIFEPYFTTKKDGTGIGLAIAKKIVGDHKGQIKVESKLNEGTKVHIYLQTI